MEARQAREESEPTRGPAGGCLWTPANGISLLRAALTVPTLTFLFLGPPYRWHVFGLVMVMVATDVLDGALARWRGEITEWGKVLDPIADKIAIDSISAALVYLKGLPGWVAITVIGRDVLIVAGGFVLASHVRSVPSSNAWGKATTCTMAGLLLSYAMDFDPPKVPLLWGVGVLLAVSTAAYGLRFVRTLGPGTRARA